ncbi:MAG: polymer-forming cytoskeletal protein [Kiloniellales bacterium]|nr:polymer-forming cytoskeletal protein [Kiloniellales bacterium]
MASATGTKERRNRDLGSAPPARPAGGRPMGGSVVGMPAARSGPASESLAGGTGGVLVIGREIEVKGEIGRCQTLVVEGKLEASVEVGFLQLAEDGLFSGQATVEDVEVAGRYEGELTVRGELLLRPTARVEGRIRYGRIVIEGGGEISGDIAVLPPEERAKSLQERQED